MQNRPLLLLLAMLAALAIFARVGAADNADENDSLAKLREKGLHKAGQFFALGDEAELYKKYRTAAPLHKKVILAQQKQAQADRQVEEKKKTLTGVIQQRRLLRAQLQQTTGAAMRHKISAALNELADQATLLQQSNDEEKTSQAARAAAATVSEQYVDLLLQLRSQSNDLHEKYKALAADDDVIKAIAICNAHSEKQFQLGPSGSLAAVDRGLKKLESGLPSDSIPLQRGGGGLWHVTISLNGKYAMDIAIDTGASVISLPYKAAQAAGMAPSEQDPMVQCMLADGRRVAAHRVTASSVRLGKFTVKDVECTVMPADLPNAQPLLGMSFFKHFIFKIDAAQSKLVMSNLDAPEKEGRRSATRQK